MRAASTLADMRMLAPLSMPMCYNHNDCVTQIPGAAFVLANDHAKQARSAEKPAASEPNAPDAGGRTRARRYPHRVVSVGWNAFHVTSRRPTNLAWCALDPCMYMPHKIMAPAAACTWRYPAPASPRRPPMRPFARNMDRQRQRSENVRPCPCASSHFVAP